MDALALKALNELSTSQRMALLPYLQRGGLVVADPETIASVWVPQWVKAVSDGDHQTLAQMKTQGMFEPVLACALPADTPPLLSQVLLQDRGRWVTTDSDRHAAWRDGVGRLISQVMPAQGEEACLQMAHLRRLLDLGEWELASALRDQATLDLNALSLQEKTPLARLETPGAWAWFLAEGGDPMQVMADEEPLWVWVARKASVGPHRPRFFKIKDASVSFKHLSPSTEALDWARHHDPRRAQALVDQQYFDQLQGLRDLFSQKGLLDVPRDGNDQSKARRDLAWRTLTSRPDWAQLRHPSGVPALFEAVNQCPHLLLMLQREGASAEIWNLRKEAPDTQAARGWVTPAWHRRLQSGSGLWDVLVTSFVGVFATSLTHALLDHVPIPAPSSERKGWLIQHGLLHNPGLVTKMEAQKNHPPAWSSVFTQRPDLFLRGTAAEQNALAETLWQSGPSCRGDEMLLAISRVPALDITPALRGALLAFRFLRRGREDHPDQWFTSWLNQGVTWPNDQAAKTFGMLRQVHSDSEFVARLREHTLAQRPAVPRPRARRHI